MDMLGQWNAAIDYLESNMCAEIDLDTAARIACVTTDSFMRFFSYMTGMTLHEYVRRRRLTLAAQELRLSRVPLIDVAVKYGYDSAAAFSRAFSKQHGMTPSIFRKHGGLIKAYPPVSFHIMIKGVKEMNFQVIEREETLVYGIWQQYEGMGYKTREELRHTMWSADIEDVPGQLLKEAGISPAMLRMTDSGMDSGRMGDI